MNEVRLIRIDELEVRKHVALQGADSNRCFYWHKYTSGMDYRYSPSNRLIKNFKIKKTEKRRLPFKEKAIKQIAAELARIQINFKNFSFVPIPPSKISSDPEYDDRNVLVLEAARNSCPDIDIQEIVKQKTSTYADHESKKRQTVADILENYVLCDVPANLKDKIIIFDDVISAGRHFKAVDTLLRTTLPQATIYGVFVARCVNPD